jgi:hypothetical protein
MNGHCFRIEEEKYKDKGRKQMGREIYILDGNAFRKDNKRRTDNVF